MYNKVILAGNLTRDVEVRYTPGGTAVGNTGLAVNRKFKSATGEQKEEVMFIDITFFGRTAEIANQYLRKGSKVLVDGRLKLDQWTAQDGSKRSKHTITVENLQMLGSRDENAAMGGNTYGGGQPQSSGYDAPAQSGYSQPAPAAPAAPQSQPEPSPSIPEIDISEDEIPF
jgi:single-strand DNA-binding protein